MKNKYNILFILIILAILVQTFSCASVAPPPGGPEDKLPPRISGSTLAPNSVNRSTNLDLTLQFDEWIVQKPPNGAVAISPPISGKLRVEADGDKLRIYSTEPLDSNTTYTLTVTNAIKDLQGNPLEKPFQILFSTGSFLDSLKTDFSVLLQDSLIRKKKFPVVAFYPFGQVRAHKRYLEKFRDSTLKAEADTVPRITKEVPLYIAQTDSLGNGVLQGMQAGSYLAVAFLDENNNQKLDATSEIAGIADFPFKLNAPRKGDSLPLLRFSLGDLDTSSFSLDAVSQRGNKEVEVSFSRNMVLDSLFKRKNNCFVLSGKDTLFPSNFYVEANSKNPVFLVDNLKNDSLYTVRCLYARDSLNRQLDTARSSAKLKFKKIPEKEIMPTVISKIEPAKEVSDVLPDLPIKLYYNHPISADTLKLRLYVNGDSVKMEVKQVDAANLEILADSIWGADSKIKLVQVEKDSVVDTLFKEKILTQFSTIARLKLASLKGEIPGGYDKTVVVLQEIISGGSKSRLAKQSKSFGRQWQARCDEEGRFEIKGVPEGIYRLIYFNDLNKDGRLTSGSIYPLKAGEPWVSPEEDLILPHGDDNILKELLKNLPSL
ncbi:MAG: Ig-like domain-containing protein [Fibromonadaceae bacterium]|jgi:uncharacterized protein (DUF2141 family)|nr:Ig-like domain-containing protein [Fibromonadaceae bacterium]